MNTHVAASQRRQWRYIADVLRELVVRDFKLRYKRSFLGIGWSLLVPLAQLIVLDVVFRRMLPLNIPHYTTFLFSGILPWTWFSASLLSACGTIVDNRDLVRQAGFPVATLPPVAVLSQLVHFLLALPILFVFLLWDGYSLTAHVLWLPVVILIQFGLTLSLSYLAATLQVTFRDTQYVLGIILFLFFYLTPVFYNPDQIPVGYQTIYGMNPMVHLLAAYRTILTRGAPPDRLALLLVGGVSGIILAVGYFTFVRARDQFVEEI
jgi:lipopolysaccharide transport system permease protein